MKENKKEKKTKKAEKEETEQTPSVRLRPIRFRPAGRSRFGRSRASSLCRLCNLSRDDDRVFAFLDDRCVVCSQGSCQCNQWDSAERVVPPLIHPRPPEKPRFGTGRRLLHDPEAIVWRGDVSLPTVDQGVWLFGTLLGHPDFVRAQLASLYDQLLQQVPTIPDLLCAWMMFVVLCRSGELHTSCCAL